MEALESKMASMLDLFEAEKERNEARLMKERQDRMKGEDQVRQLQSELMDQRRIAEVKMAETKRSMQEDEVSVLRLCSNRINSDKNRSSRRFERSWCAKSVDWRMTWTQRGRPFRRSRRRSHRTRLRI